MLEAEMRHESDSRAFSEVGIYFGTQTWAPPAGPLVTIRYTLTCNDFDIPVSRLQAKLPKSKAIQTRLLVTRPVPGGENDSQNGVVLCGLPIYPAKPLHPRDWRRVKITALPTSLQCALHDGVRWVPFQPQRLSESEFTDYVHDKATGLVPGLEIERGRGPRWETAGPLGLLVQQAQGSFRNVTITPVRDN